MRFLAGAEIFGADIYNAVGINIECDLNLRNAAGSGRNAVQIEAAQRGVAGGHFTLALQDMNLHRGLPVGGRGINLTLFDRDGGVPVDDAVENAAQRFDAQRQRRDIQQQQILDIAAQHTALNGGADSHTLIGVDALEGLFADELLHGILHGRDTGGTAHQQDLIDLGNALAGIGQRLLGGFHAGIHQIGGHLIEFGAGQRGLEMKRAGAGGRDEGQVDVGGGHAGQLNLRLFGRVLESLHHHFVAAQIHAVFTLEPIGHPVDDALVEIVAAQPRVAVGGQHLENAVRNFQDRHIESTAAQVKDHNGLIFFLVHAVSQRRGGRLVDNPLDIKAGDLACVLGGLPLCVREVSRHGDDGFGDRRAEISFRISLQLLQNHGRNLLRRVALAVDFHFIGAAHVPFDGADCPVGVGDGLALCNLADHALAGLGKRHHGRRGARPFGVGNHMRFIALENCHTRVGRTQINTDNFSHNCFLQKELFI